MEKPTLYMMIGLPASGKSTIAKKYSEKYNANIHSSDTIREELSGDINNQTINNDVFNVLHKRIKDDLLNGKSCVYDATNLSYKRRKAFLEELKKISCYKVAVLCATPFEVCLKRNLARDRIVPNHAMLNLYKSFTPPHWYEGWDTILIDFGEDNEFLGYYGRYYEFAESYNTFEQDNYHHSKTLGEHCINTANHIMYTIENPSMYLMAAATIHDLGKPETKTFVNCKGETTDIAHYYSHEHVGSYKALFYDYNADGDHFTSGDILYTAVLVNWHMTPYFWEKDNNTKMQEKYKKLWGEDLYSDIMILHEADKYAH